MARFTLALALWLFTSTAHAQLTRDAVGNGRSALEAQLTSGARLRFLTLTEPLGHLWWLRVGDARIIAERDASGVTQVSIERNFFPERQTSKFYGS